MNQIQYTRYAGLLIFCLAATSLQAQILFTKKDVSCYGGKDGSIMLQIPNATPPLKFQWNDGVTSQNRVNLSGGTYYVTVTDATKCDHIKSIEIEEPDRPLDLIITTKAVDGTFACGEWVPIDVIAEAVGGTSAYKINGSPGVQEIIRVSRSRTVTFTVVDMNQCTKIKEKDVLVGKRACPKDPNDIIGPSGYAEAQWIARKDTLDYTIRFENDPLFATAPAQRVFVTMPFDAEINPYTFRLGSFGFGEYIFDVPENSALFQKRLDLTDDLNVYLDVVAGIDVQNNQAFWSLVAIDPITGLQPIDPFVGFLPVNDTLTGSGEGFVTFFMRAKNTTTTGDTAHAQAHIVFNTNEAIETNIWHNVIDAFAPSSEMDTLPAETTNRFIPLSWTGDDDPGGCGLREYRIFVSVNGSPFELAASTSADTLEYVYEGEYGKQYGFYVTGVDYVDNIEVKTTAEASTHVLPQKSINLLSPLADVFCINDSIVINWELLEVDSVDLLFRISGQMSLTTITAGLDTLERPHVWDIPDSLAGTDIKVYIMDSDSSSILDSSLVLGIQGYPDVDAGDDRELCVGELIYLIPDGANTYQWFPQIGLNNQNSTTQALTGDTTTKYFVTGTDAFGCQNTDSINITVHPVYLDSITAELCDGDSIFVEGAYQTEAGFYTDELISSQGCDSTVVTEIVITGPCPFPSPVVYVDQDAMGLNNGTSWVDAFTDLQDALTAVEYYFNVNEIWIAEGDYITDDSGDRMVSFVLRDSVWVYGGFTGVETMRAERLEDPSLVQISGDIGIPGDSTDNAFHVFTVDPECENCILDGMTIQFGQADFIFNEGYIGAGIFNKGKLLLDACIVERNTSILDGAAIYNTGASADITIKDCIFRLNTSGLERDILNIDGATIRFKGLNQVQE